MKGREAALPRSRLGRDIAIIVAIKLLALLAIKLIWFSDPPPTTNIDRVLLGPAVQQQSVRGHY